MSTTEAVLNLTMEAATANRRSQFDEIYSRDAAGFMRIARLYGGPDAEDLYQEIAMAIWLALANFRGQCSTRTYAFRIAHNRGLSYRSGRFQRDSAAEPLHEEPAAPETMDRTVQQADRFQQLMNALKQLPDNMQQVIALSLEGFSYDEIAGVTGLTRSHVGVLLNRGKQRLQTLINE